MRYPSLVLAAVAAFVLATPASAKILITVDKSAQEMTVVVDGVTRWTWPVSTGWGSYDTPGGTHTAFRMEKEHFSKEFDDAPMPHSIFFTKAGHAIHGSYETRRLGTPASHGCVRLAPANAAKLYALVEQQGVTNTTVVLTGDVRVAMARTPRTADVAGPARASGQQPVSLLPAGAQARYEPQTEAESQYGYRQPQYGYQQQRVYQQQPAYEHQSTYQQPAYQQQPAYAQQPQQPFRALFPFLR